MKKILFYTTLLLLSFSCGNNRNRPEKNTSSTDKTEIDQATSISNKKTAIKVFIENSGSMDGYVKGVTEFEQTVYNYLSDIKIANISDTLDLFYINSKIIHQGADVADFIEKLEPSTFKKRGGERGTSDIAIVLDSVLKETMSKDISIVVTDGIFSPGKGIDAEQYLINQQIGIKRIFAEYIAKASGSAVIVYQLSSNFNGLYYNNVDKPIPINEQRPYYIWVIGELEQLANLRNTIDDEKLKERSGNKAINTFAVMNGIQNIRYSVSATIGRFKKDRNDNKSIIDLERDSRNDQIKFAVNVNFSKLLLTDDYLLNPDNYDNNSKYNFEIKPNKKNGYTHTITFTPKDNKIHKGEVVLKLKSNMPKWIEETNDDIGVSPVKNKTYGIKYQLQGVYEAFTFKNKHYTEIKININ